MMNDSKAQRRVRATSCPVSLCPAYGQELTDSKEVTLSGSYLIGSPSLDTQPVTSLVIGVPKTSNLTGYLAFTHPYTVVPQSYMTPNKSWILLRHQGVISHDIVAELSGVWLRHDRHPSSEDKSSQVRCQPNPGQTHLDPLYTCILAL